MQTGRHLCACCTTRPKHTSRHQHLEVAQVTEQYLARLHEREPSVQSFITVAADAARSSAFDLDRAVAERGGAALGPLTGVPVGIKVGRCLSAQGFHLQRQVWVPDLSKSSSTLLIVAGAWLYMHVLPGERT